MSAVSGRSRRILWRKELVVQADFVHRIAHHAGKELAAREAKSSASSFYVRIMVLETVM
jgi:hypothetical protein